MNFLEFMMFSKEYEEGKCRFRNRAIKYDENRYQSVFAAYNEKSYCFPRTSKEILENPDRYINLDHMFSSMRDGEFFDFRNIIDFKIHELEDTDENGENYEIFLIEFYDTEVTREFAFYYTAEPQYFMSLVNAYNNIITKIEADGNYLFNKVLYSERANASTVLRLVKIQNEENEGFAMGFIPRN